MAAPATSPLESVPGAYQRPAAAAEGELRDKGSRFLALLLPASDAAAANLALDAVRRRYPDATHHCWAWRLGNPASERSNDDGEPSGTAGVPILRVLHGADLADALLVVVRWFGGVKLGKGGLARAYAGAAREAVAAAQREWSVPTTRLRVVVAYDRVGGVQRLVRPPAVELDEVVYGEHVTFELRFWRHLEPELRSALRDLGAGAGEAAHEPAGRGGSDP